MTHHTVHREVRRLEALLLNEPDNIGLRQQLARCHTILIGECAADQELTAAFNANLEVLYALNPRDAVLGSVHLRLTDPGCQAIGPDDPEAAERFARWASLGEQRWDDEAERLLEEALRLQPDSIAIHRELGKLRLTRGQAQTALVHWRHAASLAGQSAFLTACCAAALADLGDADEAFACYLEALCLDPLCTDADLGLRQLCQQTDRLWVKAPIRPVVLPRIDLAGQATLVTVQAAGWAARTSWRAWATTVIEQCHALPPTSRPLAGLPRDIGLLRDAHLKLLATWRRTRRFSPRRSPGPAEHGLFWLTRLTDAGLLDAYLHYSFSHPALRDEFRRWQAARPDDLRRFLHDWVAPRKPRGEAADDD